MKVWELIAALAKMPAGKDIFISTPGNSTYGLAPTSVCDSDEDDETAVVSIQTRKD